MDKTIDKPMNKPVNTSKKNITPTHIIRRLTQIIAFLVMPGLFTNTFYAIKALYQDALKGTFTWSTISAPVLILLATIPLTILMGRFFCGFFCSFGAMGDLLWFISKKTIKPKFRISEGLDAALKWVKYGILAFIVIIFWTFGAFTLSSTASPWAVFGMYTSIGSLPAVTTLMSMGGLLLLLIIIGSLFIERFFCRYLCPLGAVYAILSKLRLFHIIKKRDHCGACRVCTNHCSMGIPLYQYDKVTSGECINCFACVEHCPRKNVKANPKPAVASALSIMAISGLYYVGSIATDGENAGVTGSSYSTSITAQAATGKYADGTYTGTGTGFRGQTKVSVTIANGLITDITVVSYSDDTQYFSRAKSTVISKIISQQSTNVSAVSGATYSSKGIMNAVENALSGALVSDSASSTTESTTASSATTSTSGSTAAASSTTSSASGSSSTSSSSGTQSFTDGTYTGSGTGYKGTTKVSVTVSGGKITDITIVSYADDAPYFSRAKSTVISEIIQNQSVNVTAVSGATFSSNGIMSAVANALGVSYTNTGSSSTKKH
jgi:uncharacterized protein with FMN-binding domain/NAD-dependent dihydropyrimidine dehydrogenase PreA subunit